MPRFLSHHFNGSYRRNRSPLGGVIPPPSPRMPPPSVPDVVITPERVISATDAPSRYTVYVSPSFKSGEEKTIERNVFSDTYEAISFPSASSIRIVVPSPYVVVRPRRKACWLDEVSGACAIPELPIARRVPPDIEKPSM